MKKAILLFLFFFQFNLDNVVCGDQLVQTNAKEQKRNLRQNSNARELASSLAPIFLNILTLGGSITWGARIADRFNSYPHVLEKISDGKYTVVNKAMRATDAYYPSLCIESMLEDTNEMEFNVIMLEYSVNGPHGIDTLVKRLQYRFPDAIFIYVHIYSLSTVIIDNRGKPANEFLMTERNSVQWHWDPDSRKAAVRPAISDFFKQIGGYVYSLPKTEISPYGVMPLFAEDWHHLSEEGHAQVAHELKDLISRAQYNPRPQTVNGAFQTKWGYGDSCHNWFESGKVTLNYEGADLKSLYTKEAYIQNKFSLEFYYSEDPNQNEGVIGIMNSHSTKVPLFVTYLSAPDIYPITNIIVDGRVSQINPDRDAFHVAVTKQIGFAEPGYNNIIIQPKTASKAPFRLVGVVLFGFHNNADIPLRKAHNIIPAVSSKDPEKSDSAGGKNRTLNVLTLGGPITWGGNLEAGELAYPARIGQLTNHKITNFGVRASDAFYPSLCIQSMLGADYPEFDVILLEYSSTNPTQHLASEGEIRGLKMLIKRLQYRFPNAIIVYVHLYSLRHVIKDAHGNLADQHDEPPPNYNWEWAYTHKEIYSPPKDVKNLMKSVGGFIYSFPIPKTPQQTFGLFSAPFYDSLNSRGHRIVGDALADLLKKAKFDAPKIQHENESMDGSWGYGDQCQSWLNMGGTVPIEYGGGEKRDLGDFEWSIEFVSSEEGGWVKIINTKEVATPLYLTYRIGGSPESGTIVSANGVTTRLDLNGSNHDKFQTTDIGWVAPGTNLVSIKPEPGSVLQLIGFELFGFYQHRDLPLKPMHNTIVQGGPAQ